MLLEGITCLGEQGLIVPAKTISPSLNFARAKFLASVSFSNVLVARGLRLLGKAPLLCTSNVTYQVRTRLMQGARVILLRPTNWAKHSFGPWLTAAANRLHHNVLVTALGIAEARRKKSP